MTYYSLFFNSGGPKFLLITYSGVLIVIKKKLTGQI
jgi:hypothetical protein